MPNKVRLLMVLLFISTTTQAQWFKYSSTAMTTEITLEFWHGDQTKAKQISQRVFSEFKRIESVMTRYDESSELSGINKHAANKPVKVSNELFTVLSMAQKIAVLSQGAFDITFASVGYLYDYRQAKQPDASDVLNKLSNINFRNIVLNNHKQTIYFKREGVLIDLGGIAKGYAVDQGIKLLKKSGVKFASLSAGGDMRLLGDKKGKPWIVGIKDPRAVQNENQHVVVLPLSDTAISTSGDYERFFIDEHGDRIHHILSPKTGRSVKGVQSVTVLGPDSVTSDGLSTAIFVLGVEKGIEMVERLPGIDVVIIDALRKVHFSEGLMPPKKHIPETRIN